MTNALDIRVRDVRIHLIPVEGRLPFRFGSTTVRHITQALVDVEIETRDGARSTGRAADFLSYAWFDKTPGKPPEVGTRDLLECIEVAAEAWKSAGFGTAFAQWRDLHPALEQAGLERGQNRLSSNFGVSMVERGVIDAIGKLTGASFHAMMLGQVLGVDEPSVFPELQRGAVAASLPETPLKRLDLRHTVGLVDPLSASDVSDPLNDGLPETLEDYLTQQKLRYLKVKISSDETETLARLQAIAELLSSVERPLNITLDGNEQFADIEQFAAMAEKIRATVALGAFWQSVLFIEQPVERTAALEKPINPATAKTIGKPVIIDESDGWTTAFSEAIELGYRGVSHKNCKGVFRSFLNNALAEKRNAELGEARFFLSAEDLSCLPIVSMNADLTAVASLGIDHCERNGHHYFRGLQHLPPAEIDACSRYGGLYRPFDGGFTLSVTDGSIDVSSLSGPGFGG